MPYTRRNLPHIDNASEFFVTYRQGGTWRQEGKPITTIPLLNRPEIANVILDSWHSLNGNSISLFAVCIMPDHVHAVFDIKPESSLSKVMYSHKRFTGRRINQLLGRSGPFWQEESFDRMIRSGKLYKPIEYTILNPVRVELVSHWQDWPFLYLDKEISKGLSF